MTPERFRRLNAVLDQRQPDLALIVDEVNKPHNLSAIVRTADAIGIPEVLSVAPSRTLRLRRIQAASAMRWVHVQPVDHIDAALDWAQQRGMQTVAAHWSDRAVDFRQIDYTRATCVIAGSERYGVSARAAERAEVHAVIPMQGMVESLNVSVATALILFEAQRQRAAAGLYAHNRLDPVTRSKRLFEWLYPDVAEFCRRHDRTYPALDADGFLICTPGEFSTALLQRETHFTDDLETE